MSVQAADALMSIFGFERVTLRGDDESGKTAAHGLLEVVMSDKMREEFEKWARKHNEELKDDDIDGPEEIRLDRQAGVYIWANAESAWYAWQASRAALVVELPVIVDKEWACTRNECSAMRDAIRFCAQKIQAAGVKTK